MHTPTPVGHLLCSRLLTHSNSTGIVSASKARVASLQQRSYGLRDEEYLHLKVLPSMLGPI